MRGELVEEFPGVKDVARVHPQRFDFDWLGLPDLNQSVRHSVR